MKRRLIPRLPFFRKRPEPAPAPASPVERARALGVRIGRNVRLIEPISPVAFSTEPYLIEIGDGTTISFEVVFLTHDGATRVIRHLPDGNPETVIYGPIKIGRNCFIGCRSTILPNVTIGDNSIVGACSLVNRDIPPNSVAAGNPCRVICSLAEYRKKHESDFRYVVSLPREEKKRLLLESFGLAGPGSSSDDPRPSSPA